MPAHSHDKLWPWKVTKLSHALKPAIIFQNKIMAWFCISSTGQRLLMLTRWYIYIYTHETYMYIFNFSYLKLVLLHTNIQNSIRLQENPTTNFGKRIPLLTKREGEVINTQKKWQTSCNAKHKKFIYSMLSLSFLLNLKSWKQQHPVTFFATHFFGFCLFNNPWFVYSTELKYWLQKFSSLQRRQQQA